MMYIFSKGVQTNLNFERLSLYAVYHMKGHAFLVSKFGKFGLKKLSFRFQIFFMFLVLRFHYSFNIVLFLKILFMYIIVYTIICHYTILHYRTYHVNLNFMYNLYQNPRPTPIKRGNQKRMALHMAH